MDCYRLNCFECSKIFGEVKYWLATDKLDQVRRANGVVEERRKDLQETCLYCCSATQSSLKDFVVTKLFVNNLAQNHYFHNLNDI